MGEAAADGAARAHRAVGDAAGDARKKATGGVWDAAVLDGGVGDSGADGDGVPVLGDGGKLGNARDVDEDGGPRQAQVEHRPQGLAAGEDPRSRRAAQRVEGLGDGGGADVVEGGGLHAAAPPVIPDGATRAEGEQRSDPGPPERRPAHRRGPG